ncbi:hypothetical protein L207DRAFT_580653 [Hyaloscypha variabilis F]|uniref:Uncharacterized protein n=1 Tax=Hyaloscypha variabilis (strain UAMH 11265 / GT02V1 / F) TaxID=1149755 RepID=A0A2J6RTY9_HYAVF|nr:hypothetical protein L207DRAFT_580653 [Hyaloscypha variabilis F]
MDFLKKAEGMMNNGGSSNNQANQQGAVQGQGQAVGSNQNEDYGDKGLDFIEKKTGHTMGRDTNEKITDGVRGMYEKATGKSVDAKYSN